jgi:hypothetical protein
MLQSSSSLPQRMGNPGTRKRERERKRENMRVVRLEQRVMVRWLQFHAGRSGEWGTTHKKKREGGNGCRVALLLPTSRQGNYMNLYTSALQSILTGKDDTRANACANSLFRCKESGAREREALGHSRPSARSILTPPGYFRC